MPCDKCKCQNCVVQIDKICSICNEKKNFSEIVKDHTYCKQCQVIKNKNYYEMKTKTEKSKLKQELKKEGKKQCSQCFKIFTFLEMSKITNNRVGSKCLMCYKDYCKNSSKKQYEKLKLKKQEMINNN